MRAGISKNGDIEQVSAGYFKMASGSTAQRPIHPQNGMIRFNTDLGYAEQYNGSWLPLDNGGSSFSPGFQDNVYYGSPTIDGMTITSQYFNSGTIYALPFYVPQGESFNRIGVSVSQAGYQSTIRIGMYSNVDAAPGTKICDFGTVSSASTGDKEVSFSNPTGIDGGWVWIAAILSTGVNLYGYGWTNNGSNVLGRPTSTTYASTLGITATGSGTTLPTTFPTKTLAVGIMPYLWIRKV